MPMLTCVTKWKTAIYCRVNVTQSKTITSDPVDPSVTEKTYVTDHFRVHEGACPD